MTVYNKDGVSLSTIYDKSGSLLNIAYDAEGNPLFVGNSLLVMEYNVGGWYIGSGTNVPANQDAAFYELQNGILSRQNADILCICEYWSVFSKTGRTAASLLSQYFPYIHEENGTSNYWGRCICSKYPIESYTVNVYAGDTSGRYYDKATINFNGTLVDTIVTHLHPSDKPERIRTAKILFDYTQTLTHPWIVCGDFNSNLFYPFTEVNAAIYQQFLDAGCSIANDGAFGILPTACNSADWETDKFAIDNIITAPEFTIDDVWTDISKTTNAAVLATGKIDHIPLVSQLTITEA